MSREPHADRDPVMKAIKDKLLRWTCERHATDCPLDRHLLRDKALELAGEHGLTGFKCSDRWLTCFLKKHSFSLDPNDSSGPVFGNYRFWIDAMRSVITQYKHKDLFHLDELTMYSDVSPAGVSSAMYHTARQDASLKRTTVLMCCNAAGTEKSPLLICGTYPAVLTSDDHVYIHSEDASISDEFFREWLSRLNDRMSHSERKILLLLHRERASAFQGFRLSNVRHIFFPENFPPLLRPLKRDVFHFVKMIYRSKYVEGIKEHGRRWNVENVVESLLEAWRKVPRALIIASFQRTSFRTDDCFLEIHCDVWQELKAGMSFEKFVTFDDDLSAAREHRRASGHNYNLRTKEDDTLVDVELEDARREFPVERIFDESQAKGDSRRVHGKVNIDRKKKSSLKRSHEEVQPNEDLSVETANAASTDNSIADPAEESQSHEEVAVTASPAKRPRIISIERFYVAKRQRTDTSTQKIVEPEEIDSIASRTSADHVAQAVDDTINHQETRHENAETSGSGEQRSMEASSADDFTSQQVSGDASATDAATRNPNTSVVFGVRPGEETKSRDTAMPAINGNHDHSSLQSSPRRRRSRSVDVEEPLDDDGEPKRKKSRSDYDWTKRYETTFVFGSQGASTALADVAPDDEDAQQPRGPCEIQKNIFTIRPRKD